MRSIDTSPCVKMNQLTRSMLRAICPDGWADMIGVSK
jgi:hypothetical protein